MILANAIVVIGLCTMTLAQPTSLTTNFPQSENSSFLADNKFIIGLLLFLLLLLAAIILDRRNGSPYLAIVQGKARQILQRIRNAAAKRKLPKKEKLSGDEAIPTSKDMHNNMFDSEKTYVQADINSIQETVSQEKKQEAVSTLQLEDETPKVDLKEVFGQKDGQTSKRSKSKIKSRIQIKKSQRESEDSQQTEESKGSEGLDTSSAVEVSKAEE